MTERTIGERLATLETQIEFMEKEAADRKLVQDAMDAKLDTLILDSKSLKSFMGGAMWIGMGMVTVLWKIGPWLLSFFKAKTGNG